MRSSVRVYRKLKTTDMLLGCLSLLQAFKRYEILTRKREAEIMREVESKKVEEMAGPPPPPNPNEDELPIVVPDEEEKEKEKAVEPGKQGPETKPAATALAAETKHLSKKDLEEYQSKKERAMAFNETSDIFNGAEMDNYKWSQTITELEIKVMLPEGTSGKDVRVDIRSDHLKVEVLKPEYQVHACQCSCVCWGMYVCLVYQASSLFCLCAKHGEFLDTRGRESLAQ